MSIQYSMEVYESPRTDTPIVAYRSDNPFLAVSVGDYFMPYPIEPSKGKRFRVKEITHVIWHIKDSHIGHKLMIVLVRD